MFLFFPFAETIQLIRGASQVSDFCMVWVFTAKNIWADYRFYCFNINKISCYVIFRESAKSCTLRALVPYVLSCPTCLVPYFPSCFTCLVPYVSLCLTCLVPYVLSCLTCFVPCVLSYPLCLVPYLPRALGARVLCASRVLCGLVHCALRAVFLYVPYCQYYFEVMISIYSQYHIFELFETKYENIHNKQTNT